MISFTLQMPEELLSRVKKLAKERSKKLSKNVALADVAREAIVAGLPALEKN